MKTNELYRSKVERYIASVSAGDVDRVVSLFAPDATVEDPVGSERIQGHEAIRAFYLRATKMKIKLHPTGPIRIAGSEAAFPFQVRGETPAKMEIDVIDVFRFDDEGLISEMRAYWGKENMRLG